MQTLRERVRSYSDLTDQKLIKRLPVVIVINGRSFKKITSLLHKPFSPELMETMCGVMVKLCQEIDGTIFGYSFNDEIVLIVRNDQSSETDAWYDNRVQKIVSASAALATFEFNRLIKINEVNVLGDPIFTSKTFVVPNLMEAINVLIFKQQEAFGSASSLACFYELIKKYEPGEMKDILNAKTSQSKVEILKDECGIDFEKYPLPFRRGVCCYRAPKIVDTDGGKEIKNKLTISMELPIFAKDQEFLRTIFNSGKDIFRAKR